MFLVDQESVNTRVNYFRLIEKKIIIIPPNSPFKQKPSTLYSVHTQPLSQEMKNNPNLHSLTPNIFVINLPCLSSMIEPMAFLHIPLHLEPLIMSDAQTLLETMTHTKSNSPQNSFYCPSSHARHQMIRLRSLHPNVISPKGSPMRCLYNPLNTPTFKPYSIHLSHQTIY